jgi:hypothetical protein
LNLAPLTKARRELLEIPPNIRGVIVLSIDDDSHYSQYLDHAGKPRHIARSTTTRLCGCAGGCDSSTRSGDARAGAIHSRTFMGTSGSYA